MTVWEKKKDKVNELLVCLIVAGFYLYGAAIMPVENPGVLFRLWLLGVMGLATLKICIQKNTFMQWGLFILLMVVSVLCYRTTYDRVPILFALGVCCVKDINLDKVIKVDLAARLACILAYLILPYAGLIENHVNQLQGGRYRTWFGWGNANGMGIAFLFFCMDWIYLKHLKMKWYDYLGIGCIIIFCDLTANSRTAEAILAALLIYEFAAGKWIQSEDARNKVMFALSLAALALAVALPLYSFIQYPLADMGIQLPFPETVKGRLELTKMFYDNHGLTPFGASYVGIEYLDMLFACVWLSRGWILGGITLLLFIAANFWGYKKKNEKYLLLMFVMALYGTMESEHFSPIHSILPMLLGMPVFDRDTKSEE